MMKKNYYIEKTSIFVHIPVIAAMLLLSVLAVHFSMENIAMVLLPLAFVSLISFIWGRYSLQNMSVTCQFDKHIVYPGDEVTFRCTLQNEKWFPVVSVVFRIPIPAEECLLPACKEDYRMLDDIEISKARLEHTDLKYVFERKFAFLIGHEKITWETKWKAHSRGLFQIEQVELYGGDCFGLFQCGKQLALNRDCYVAICPNFVNVNSTRFMQNIGFSDYGKASIFDDPSQIRMIREYRQYDPIKQINWRILATQQKVMINLYEKLKTKGVHLILDGESFNGEKPQQEALEETIQWIYSIMVSLTKNNIGCGLSLPKSRNLCAVCLPYRGFETFEHASYYLAGYHMLPTEKEEDQGQSPILMERSSLSMVIMEARQMKQKREGTYMQCVSEFLPVEDVLSSGADDFYYFTFDQEKMHLRETDLMKALRGKNVTILSYKHVGGVFDEKSK